MRWDPGQYSLFAEHRGRPFLDLVNRIHAEQPRRVVDLGCGAGKLTALLAQRWPGAQVQGIDSSPEMIESTEPRPGLSFSLGDVAEFDPIGIDVVLSNATLQWLPQHRDLLARWAAQLAPGSWLAFQVPGNFRSPSHTLMYELAMSTPWSDKIAAVGVPMLSVGDALEYAVLLADQGLRMDAWETTYIHVLTGADPVLEWMRGTGLRPILQALSAPDGAAFAIEYARLLRKAYPPGPAGTLLPYRRIFAVGQKA